MALSATFPIGSDSPPMPLNLQAKLDLLNTDPYLISSFRRGPVPEDEVLFMRLGGNFRAYKELRKDPRVSRSLSYKRCQPVIGRPVLVEPLTDSKADKDGADKALQILKRMNYESLTKRILESGLLVGFHVERMDFDTIDGLTYPVNFQPVPQERFTFDYFDPEAKNVDTVGDLKLNPETEICTINGYELRLLTKRQPFYGERVPKNRFIVFSYGSLEGYPWGVGLGYQLYRWWKIKNEAVGSFLLHGDRLGSPPIWAEIPASLPKAHPLINQVEGFIKAISPNLWAMIPEGVKVQMIEMGSSGGEIHERLIELCDRQIDLAIVGEVPMSEKSSSSRAANESQVDDRNASITDGDCDLISECLQEYLWNPIRDLNYSKANVTVRRETTADIRRRQEKQEQADKDEQKRQQRASTDKVLIIDIGLTPPDNYAAETYGEGWKIATTSDTPGSEGQTTGAEEPPTPESPDVQDGGANFVEFGIPAKYAHINFVPPQLVQAAARQGLEMRRNAPKSKKGGLSHKQAKQQRVGSGVQRAVNLANGHTIAPDTIKRIVSFFARHKNNTGDRAKIAKQLWGGDAGKAWANKIYKQMLRADASPNHAEEIRHKYFSLVNMSVADMRSWGDSPYVVGDRSPINRTISLLETEQWTAEDYAEAQRAIAFIESTQRYRPDSPLLLNWGRRSLLGTFNP